MIRWMYFVSRVARLCIFQDCKFILSTSTATIHSRMFDNVIAIMTHCCNSHIHHFVNIYTLYINDRIIKTMYIYLQSTFVSIIRIFVDVLNIFVNHIVIIMGFNNDEYDIIYCNCLSCIDSIMIFVLIAISEMIICIGFQLIKQYFNDLNNNLGGNKSANNEKYQYYEYMNCVTIDCILLCIMSDIWMNYFIYSLLNYIVLQQMTLLHCCIQIMIALIVFSIVSCKYYKYNTKFVHT